MKNRVLSGIVIATFLSGMSIFAAPDVNSIIRMVDRVEGFRSMYSEGYQVITTTSGAKRKLVARSWAVNNGKKQLTEYTYPSDIKGQKILMTAYGDNIWMFNPETRRTRKLGSHMRKRKVMGSDFTYEDQAGGRLAEKYRGIYLRKENYAGVPCHVIQLKPTPKGPSYAKIIAWVGTGDYVTRRVDYYEKGDNNPFKRLILEDVRSVDGKKVPFKMTMTNLTDRTETLSVMTRVRFGVELPMSIFESRNLGR